MNIHEPTSHAHPFPITNSVIVRYYDISVSDYTIKVYYLTNQVLVMQINEITPLKIEIISCC